MKKTILLILTVLFSATTAMAESQKLPLIPNLHPSVTQGQLANGLRYLIKPISAEAGQSSEVELRLLVNSGSLSEAKDERGIAHLIEHMAFRRTVNFGKDEIKALYSSNGMRLGNDTNAFTAHENTAYFLKLKAESLNSGLLLVADWANGKIVFDPEELKTERQVVLDEINLRRGDSNGWRSFFSVLIPNAPHLENMPIGYEENVRDLSPERIEKLYRQLYQPQKMTLIIAGAVPANIEETVKKLFSESPIGDQIAQYSAFPLTPKVRSYRGSPWPQNELAVSWSFLQLPTTDASQVQLQKIGLLALSQRLSKLSVQEHISFSSALMMDWSGTIGRESYLTLYATVKQQNPGAALTQLYREIRRAREFGLSDSEVSDAIANLHLQLKSLTNSNDIWANNLLAAAKLGYPNLFVANQKTIFDPKLIATERVNSALRQVLTSPDQVAMLMGPALGEAHKDLYSWNDEKLAEMMAGVDAESLSASIVHKAKTLLNKEPTRGQVVQTRTDNGATVWTLSNGAQVLIRKQRQPEERIGLNARYPGGALALPNELRFVSQMLPTYMSLSGAGSLTPAEITQAIRNEELQLQPMFETAQHGFGGFAAERSLEPLLQLMYLSIAQPRSDNLARLQSADKAITNYWPNGPGFLHNLYGASWPYRVWGSLNDFEISTDKLDQLRQQLYGHPDQLRVVLTGISNISQAKDLVERYIASIPVADPRLVKLLPKKIEPKDLELPTTLSERLKESLSKFTYHNEKYAQWSVALREVEANTQNAFLQEGLNDVIKQRLFTVLREKEGESYVVNSWGEMSPYYGPTLSFEYSVTADKCGQALLQTAQELQKLSQHSVTDEELNSMHDFMQKGLDNGPKYPFWYAYSQMFHWVNNQDLGWIDPNPQKVLSRTNVDAAAKSWFLPEKWIVAASSCKSLPDLSVLDKGINVIVNK